MRVQNQMSVGGGKSGSRSHVERSHKASEAQDLNPTNRSRSHVERSLKASEAQDLNPTNRSRSHVERTRRVSEAQDLNNKKAFIKADVDSPYNEPGGKHRTERVMQRVSDNPLLLLHSRGKITQSQFLAGHKYRAAHLVCTGQAGQAIDYSRQRVDYSVAPMTLSEKQMHASDLIRNANRELCREGVNEKSANEAVLRVQKIAGEGYNVTQYCKSVRGLSSNKSISKQLGFLAEDLSVLAKHWGFER